MFASLLKWTINAWIALTGKVVKFKDHPWLEGPTSDSDVVGDEYYNRYAAANGLTVDKTTTGGLLEDFKEVLSPDDPLLAKLNPRVAHFYEHTVQYKLEVWSQWYSPMSFFAKILIRSLSSKMDQLNIPLQPLETSRGMSNEVLHLKDKDGKLKYACWLRKKILSGRVVYAGFYTKCFIDGKPFVKVVFPLPKGSATVILKVNVEPDGSAMLISRGKGIGDAGYYRLRQHMAGSVKVKYFPLKESIHVFEDEDGTLRTDHKFSIFKMRLLHLHYKIIPVSGAS